MTFLAYDIQYQCLTTIVFGLGRRAILTRRGSFDCVSNRRCRMHDLTTTVILFGVGDNFKTLLSNLLFLFLKSPDIISILYTILYCIQLSLRQKLSCPVWYYVVCIFSPCTDRAIIFCFAFLSIYVNLI